MYYFKKDIIVNTPGKSEYTATLQAYIPDNSPEVNGDRLRPAVLVIPGGGYFFTSDRENEPIALKLLSEGVCAFTLKYSCAPARFPQALCEALAAIKFIRETAEEYFIDPERIGVCGFSAGGHLAASVGAFWNKPFVEEYIGTYGSAVKPNKLILAYPVIKSGEYIHQGSFDNLLGDNPPDSLLELNSIDKQVSSDTPPCFLWHTYDDSVVHIQNALAFASSLAEKNIPLEMHIYTNGHHGLSLGNHIVHKDWTYDMKHDSSEWIDKAIKFLYK